MPLHNFRMIFHARVNHSAWSRSPPPATTAIPRERKSSGYYIDSHEAIPFPAFIAYIVAGSQAGVRSVEQRLKTHLQNVSRVFNVECQ